MLILLCNLTWDFFPRDRGYSSVESHMPGGSHNVESDSIGGSPTHAIMSGISPTTLNVTNTIDSSYVGATCVFGNMEAENVYANTRNDTNSAWTVRVNRNNRSEKKSTNAVSAQFNYLLTDSRRNGGSTPMPRGQTSSPDAHG